MDPVLAEPIVIVGAGHAGVGVAAALRDEGCEVPICLVNGEGGFPYQRPPLSKAFMKREIEAANLLLRGRSFYDQRNIELVAGAAARIERTTSTLHLTCGSLLRYGHLILATGSRQRRLSISPADAPIHYLGNLAEAHVLRERLAPGMSVLIVGAGFIGLEFAAVAASMNCKVVVVEIGDRVLCRSVCPDLSAFYEAELRAMGVALMLSRGVTRVGRNGAGASVAISDGSRRQADLVLAGIGTVAEDRLAREAGLACDNGVIVDDRLLTADASISAIGDCARHPNAFVPDGLARLESVQNAVDQGKTVARRLTGKIANYRSVPWFWSDQGDLKLQIAGVWTGCDRFVTRGAVADRAFSILGFRGDRLRVVESVNKPADHMAARRLIAADIPVSIARAIDTSIPLKSLLTDAKAPA